MITLRAVEYLLTLAAAFVCAFWELKLKRQLSDQPFGRSKSVSDFGLMNDLSERIARERVLESQPREALKTLSLVIRLKFVFVAIFIVEVIFLQR